ncbi:MAG: hypothetical protein JWR05_2102 [Mucilaginibacter sp.]|nr:hypothetical protein [Mucilaginibacter sp.]
MNSSILYKQPSRSIFFDLIKHNRAFQIGLIVKLILAACFASTYLTDLFAPFIRSSINNSFWNVYTDFYATKPNAFPYPPVMLYILSISRFAGTIFASATGPISFGDLFFIRLPLLFGDIGILVILIKWLRNAELVIKWYWFNPIVIYVTYIHGQLDILPTAFLCMSLYFLFTDRFYHFIVFLAIACATKFHIIMAVPLLSIYLYRTKRLEGKMLLRGAFLFAGLLLVLNLPFLTQIEYIQMVYKNPEQNKVVASFFNLFDNYRLLFIPATYMMILYLMFDFRFINKDILLIFLALSFGTITFFIVPSQGWYLWNMPFLIYFVIRFSTQEKYLFILLNINYFLFFILLPKSDIPLVAQFIIPAAKTTDNLYHFLIFHHINADGALQLMFTFLQTTLLLFCISLFRIGVLQIRKYKIYNQPYLIGICGDSGSGKSTLSQGIISLLGMKNTLIVRGDDMHRWERGHEKWDEMTHLNPQANWLHRDLADLINLKAGKKIQRRSYDHSSGKFTEKISFAAQRVIVYEGLHSFYLREVSNIYDLKIFMSPSEELRRYWKIQRDVNERGHSYQKVIDAIDKRMPDAINHIIDQQAEADIIFSIILANPGANIEDNPKENFALKVICANDIYFEELLEQVKVIANLNIDHSIDRSKQIMIIKGDINSYQINEIAEALQLNVEELMGNSPLWNDNFYGIMQLFVLYYIFNQLKKTGVLLEQETL